MVVNSDVCNGMQSGLRMRSGTSPETHRRTTAPLVLVVFSFALNFDASSSCLSCLEGDSLMTCIDYN